MTTASSMSLRVSNAARHVHTTGLFALQLHAERLASCCTSLPPRGDSSNTKYYIVTHGFLQDFTSEVREVVGSALFASVTTRKGNGTTAGEYGEEGTAATRTENAFFVVESAAAGEERGGGGASASSHVTFSLRVKDSRISAALVAAIAKGNSFIVFTDCRVMSATPTRSSETTTPEKLNMDSDLFEAIEKTVGGSASPLFVQLREQRRQQLLPPQLRKYTAEVIDGPRLLEEHKDFVSSVKAAAVYTEPGSGEASPFACLLWCLFAMPVSHEELTITLGTHQNRYLRAAAMYYARYLCPLEHLASVFAPSMDDETIIACAGDASETRSMKDLARKLLLEDEVDEAWLPTYSKWWMRSVIEPTIRLMADHKQASERAAAMRGAVRISSSNEFSGDGATTGKRRSRDEGVDGDENDTNKAKAKHNAGGGGGGKTTLMGFRSALELALFVDQARMLATGDALQQMLMAAKDQREAVAVGVEDDDDDEEAAWARKQQNANHSGAALSLNSHQEVRSDAAAAGQAANGRNTTAAQPVAAVVATVDIRKLASSRAQKAIVELLGPQGAASALRKSDPAYLRI